MALFGTNTMSTNKTPDTPCRICDNTTDNTFHVAREMMYGLRETFSYLECGKCKCLQIVEVPVDMSKYYPGDYYSFDTYDGKKFDGWKGSIKKKQYKYSILQGNGIQNVFGSLFGKKLYQLFKGLPITQETRILDVGCGNGRNFLYPLAEVGFKNLLGCDPYLSESIKYPNGLRIENSDVFEVRGAWDLITYHHSFEHLTDPLENLKKVTELLSDEGTCVIRIPTVSSFAWKHYGTDWVQLDAPRHIFLHSVESMNLLAEESGMEVTDVVYDSSHFQFTGSEKYIKDIPLSDPKKKGLVASIQRKVSNYSYGKKANKLNKDGMGDQAAFFLRKK